MREAAHPTNRHPGRPWGRRAGSLAAGLLAVGLLAAACSGGGGSAKSASGSSTSSAAGSPRPGALAYARCMRAHGVPDFPDPSANGGFNFNNNNGPSDLDPNNPQMQSAQQACKSLQPPGAVQGGQATAAMLRYAQCMRAHGITDFPDPSAQGPVAITPRGDLNPNNPQYQAANQACKSLKPQGGGQTYTNGNGGGS